MEPQSSIRFLVCFNPHLELVLEVTSLSLQTCNLLKRFNPHLELVLEVTSAATSSEV